MHLPDDAPSRFDRFYHAMYETRWDSLRESLLLKSEPISFSEGLLCPYYLDEASWVAASQLPLAEGDSVLDMCAAPGGKSLVLATRLGMTGSLTSNDRSSQRRIRLRKVLDEHLAGPLRARVTVTSHDAAKWGLHEQQRYDAILLDAPCSSERHVIQDPKALAQWSPARTRHLAIQQFAMLASALEAVRIGGHVLYSTCSISVHENDAVIAKLEKKRMGRYEIIPLELSLGEVTDHGFMILPDATNGKGPLYMSLIRRIA